MGRRRLTTGSNRHEKPGVPLPAMQQVAGQATIGIPPKTFGSIARGREHQDEWNSARNGGTGGPGE
jgi:hypothetical protein